MNWASADLTAAAPASAGQVALLLLLMKLPCCFADEAGLLLLLMELRCCFANETALLFLLKKLHCCLFWRSCIATVPLMVTAFLPLY
jgi:hypothetical protein